MLRYPLPILANCVSHAQVNATDLPRLFRPYSLVDGTNISQTRIKVCPLSCG
jgi:hypothetical protein